MSVAGKYSYNFLSIQIFILSLTARVGTQKDNLKNALARQWRSWREDTIKMCVEIPNKTLSQSQYLLPHWLLKLAPGGRQVKFDCNVVGS